MELTVSTELARRPGIGFRGAAYYRLLQQEPTISYDDAAVRLGCSVQTVFRLERALVDTELLRVVREKQKGGGFALNRIVLPMQLAS
jgi:hypothetical protein